MQLTTEVRAGVERPHPGYTSESGGRMRKHLAAIVLVALALPALAGPWSETFRFSAEALKVGTVERDGNLFSTVGVLPDRSSDERLTVVPLHETGLPALPRWQFTVVLPQGTGAVELAVEATATELIDVEHPVFPAQAPVPVSRRALPEFVPGDPAVYGSDQAWPARLAEVGPAGSKAGFRLATVTLNPLRYRPESGQLELVTRMEVEVRPKSDPALPRQSLFPGQSRFIAPAVRALVINPRDVNRYAPRTRQTDFGNVDGVIITSSSLSSGFQALADWHVRKGFRTEVKTTSWIYANYSGRDNQEKIRNFIIDYHANQGLTWVILGGDNGVVPGRRARAYCGGNTGNIPCDLYYADLDWSWDGDNDNIFGEPDDDTVDLYYDLYVGRASVDNTTQVQTFVNKVLTHEQSPPLGYLKRILLVDAELWSGYDHRQSNDSIAAITPPGWTDVHFHDPTNTTAVRDSLDHGFQFAHLVGHGDDIGIYNGSTRYYGTSVANNHSNGSKVNLLNSIACISGNFEHSDCLAEAAHNSSGGGSVGVIMNSRYGWGTPPDIGPSELLDIRFYDYFFNHDTMPVGVTHAASKEVYRGLALSQGVWRWCYYELNLFADPLLMMYEDVPGSLSLSFTDPLPVGNQNYTVTVNNGTYAVENALVCLRKGSEVYERGYTNSSGQVTLAINPSTTGHLQITATAANHLPEEDSAQVVTTSNDVGVTCIIAPPAMIDSTQMVAPSCSVYNYGTNTVSYQLRCHIGGFFDQAVNVTSHAPGERRRVIFSPCSAWPRGNHTVTCSTRLAGDQNTDNDSLTSQVFIRVDDAAADSIVRPQGAVAVGANISPQARVRNDGNMTANMTVIFRVSDGYSNVKTVSGLAPGATSLVTFDNWNAATPGSFTTTCSTRLAGDMVPGNNRLTGSVNVSSDDVGVFLVTAPTGSFDSTASVAPACSVRNYGLSTVSYQVRCRIDGFYDETVNVGSHLPGTARRVAFPTVSEWPRGIHNVACSTRLNGDLQNSNDRATGSFSVRVRDVGAVTLVAPDGVVDSGDVVTPACSVYNHGTSTETYPVRMRIGTGYDQSVPVIAHSPGTRRYVTFPDWTATPRGVFGVRCSTELTGDLRAPNNRIVDSVAVGGNDVGCYRIVAPTGTVDSGANVTPRAMVRNYSPAVATNIPVVFRIATVYSDTQQVTNLAPGDSAQVSFANWNAVPGNHTLACSTRLAGDVNPSNDRAEGNVTVNFRDVAVLSVSAPAMVDSGGIVTPVATVRNFGTIPENAQFRLTIPGTGYSETRSKVLPAGGSADTLIFPTWTAIGRGERVLGCTTLVAGDMNPDNNRAAGTTFVRVTDAACISILSPSGYVDSTGQIMASARVRNEGNVTVSFPLTFSVFGADTWTTAGQVDDLGPGDSADTDIGLWTVGPPGTYGSYCSVDLVGDQVAGNNTVLDSFVVGVHDAAAIAIVSPAGVIDSSATVPVRVVVGNNGRTTDDILTIVTVDTLYRDSALVNLASGATDTVDLADWTTNVPTGDWTVTCSTWVAGDVDTSDNVINGTASVTVRDVGVTQILSPSGQVDSGAVVEPWAVVENHGSAEETFDVWFAITDGYADTLSLTMAPHEDTILVFKDWTAQSIGVFETKCSTCLAGDERSQNDLAWGSVSVSGNDVGVYAITAPTGSIDSGPLIPGARVANYGVFPRSFWTWLRIWDGTDSLIFIDSVEIADLPGDTFADVQFAEWTAVSGSYAVRCSTWVSHDYNPANDTASTVCTVRGHDVGITGILSPTGMMRPQVVSPVLRVVNHGNVPESFWCVLVVEDTVSGDTAYRDSALVQGLNPDQARNQRLPAWTPDLGYYRHTGYTTLSGDGDRSNDTAFARLRVTPGPLGWEIRYDVPSGPEGRPVKHGGCCVGLETDAARIYALKGYKTGEFYAYDISTGRWSDRASMPEGPSERLPKRGADICTDGERYLYAAKGNNTLEFWRYDAVKDSWKQLADIPPGSGKRRKCKYGTGLAHVIRNDRAWIYCLKGAKTHDFYRYSIETNEWEILPQAPRGPKGKQYKAGSGVATDGHSTVWVMKGRYNEFYSYDVASGDWTVRPSMPDYGASGKRCRPKDGFDMAWDGRGTIYAPAGGNRPFFFAFIDSANGWVELESMPHGPSGRRIKHGGSVAWLGKRCWAMKGNKTLEFWSYTPDTMLLFGRRPIRSGQAGRTLGRIESGLFRIGPNPARDRLVVSAARHAPSATVEIISTLGRRAAIRTLAPGREVNFDIGRLATGTWFLRIRGPDVAESRKFTIMR